MQHMPLMSSILDWNHVVSVVMAGCNKKTDHLLVGLVIDSVVFVWPFVYCVSLAGVSYLWRLLWGPIAVFPNVSND
jgi:hypothetical protein